MKAMRRAAMLVGPSPTTAAPEGPRGKRLIANPPMICMGGQSAQAG